METFSEYKKRYNKFIGKMDNKEKIISRQSSLKVALEFFRDKNHQPEFLEWIRIADIISDFTIDGLTPEIKKVAKAIDDYLKEHK